MAEVTLVFVSCIINYESSVCSTYLELQPFSPVLRTTDRSILEICHGIIRNKMNAAKSSTAVLHEHCTFSAYRGVRTCNGRSSRNR